MFESLTLRDLWPMLAALVAGAIAWGAKSRDVNQLKLDLSELKKMAREEIAALDARQRSTETAQVKIVVQLDAQTEMLKEIREDLRAVRRGSHAQSAG